MKARSDDRILVVTDEFESKVRNFSTEKALAVAAYGESVAAYRYRTLAERVPLEAHRKVFVEMADEEQGHHVLIQDLIRKYYPGSDFVLSPGDKELVIAGPRMPDITDEVALRKTIDLIRESECRTGRFYAVLHAHTDQESLKPVLNEMAEECVHHAKQLANLFLPATPAS